MRFTPSTLACQSVLSLLRLWCVCVCVFASVHNLLEWLTGCRPVDPNLDVS